ncbi:MAG: hypothetical protein ACYS8W_16545 [Planctomycetota bacterium]|jgi:hypothetical protein
MSRGQIIFLCIAFVLIGLGLGLTLKPLLAGDIVQNPVSPITYTVNPEGSVIYQWQHGQNGEIEHVLIYDAKTTRYRKIKLTKIF